MSSSLSTDIEENLNYPDWEPLEHQSINNREANDKDVLETNRDQPNNRYHQDRERARWTSNINPKIRAWDSGVVIYPWPFLG